MAVWSSLILSPSIHMYLPPSPRLPLTHLTMIITAIAPLWWSLHCGLTPIVLVVLLCLSDMFYVHQWKYALCSSETVVVRISLCSCKIHSVCSDRLNVKMHDLPVTWLVKVHVLNRARTALIHFLFVRTNVCFFFCLSQSGEKIRVRKLEDMTNLIFCFQGVIQQCIKSDFKHGMAVQVTSQQCQHAVFCQMEEIKISLRLWGQAVTNWFSNWGL